MLEVIALTPDDARAASEGGADRLELVGTMADDGLSPTPGLVERVCAASAVPVRVMLRVRAGFGVGAGELPRLVDLARAFADAGASGLVLGFLDETGRLDRPVLDALLAATDLPWTFHRAIDHAPDPDVIWAELHDLPRLDQVLTAGSAAGVSDGLPRLVRWSRVHFHGADSAAQERTQGGVLRRMPHGNAHGLVMAGGGLQPHHVPVLAEAGVTAFHIGSAARRNRSFSQRVDPQQVADWRALIGMGAQRR